MSNRQIEESIRKMDMSKIAFVAFTQTRTGPAEMIDTWWTRLLKLRWAKE